MASASKTFRLFVSSTFSDLKNERNALQERVFPKLRDLCMQHGCRFQAIDLRWGVRDEAALDQQTMKICLDEIDRCKKVTPRPNFLVLLGDRYGWQPLPAEIPEDEFKAIEHSVSDSDDKELLTKCYSYDKNAVPPIYCLKPRKVPIDEISSEEEKIRSREEESKKWSLVERDLQRILRKGSLVMSLPLSDKLKYIASATEQEIASGALKVQDAQDHVFCFFRNIDRIPHDKSAKDFIDIMDDGELDSKAKNNLDELKRKLEGMIPDNIFKYTANWENQGATTDHIDKLCAESLAALSAVIIKEIEQLEDIDPLAKEIDDHLDFGTDRAKHFVGRTEILTDIAKYISASSGIPLVVHGVSGSGKSALMAQAAENARISFPDTEVFVRYIGATPDSSDGRSLLDSLCRQISRAYELDENDIPSDFKELVDDFPKRLDSASPNKPLVIILDALDQLSDAHNAKNMGWFPSKLPQNVHLISSVLPDECFSVLQKKLPGESFTELNPLDAAAGEKLLASWLQQAGRTLQDSQRDIVLGSFKKNGLPLYLKLAFEEAKRWKSYTTDVKLSSDVPGIIRDLFHRLSDDALHGQMLVSRSLAYLAAAKNGLSEDELIDVLSADREVFDDFKIRAHHEPPSQRIPAVVWSRLYFDLEPYLTERSADETSLISFYHRQLAEAVAKEYLNEEVKVKRHEVLARYFGKQPLFIEMQKEKHPHLRKISELAYQQTHGKLWNALYETLTDFNFLEAKCTYSSVNVAGKGEEARKIYGGVYDLLEDYRLALDIFPKSEGS